VYLNYGIHSLVNAVTEPEGWPAAVLIRALEPLEGVELMRKRRANVARGRAASLAVHDLCRGPGNLTRALGIGLRQNLGDLTTGPLFIEDRGARQRDVRWSRRIGISVGVEPEWRVYDASSRAVSGKKVPL
jgi:DNA-3-methyladenine glycosylase